MRLLEHSPTRRSPSLHVFFFSKFMCGGNAIYTLCIECCFICSALTLTLCTTTTKYDPRYSGPTSTHYTTWSIDVKPCMKYEYNSIHTFLSSSFIVIHLAMLHQLPGFCCRLCNAVARDSEKTKAPSSWIASCTYSILSTVHVHVVSLPTPELVVQYPPPPIPLSLSES